MERREEGFVCPLDLKTRGKRPRAFLVEKQATYGIGWDGRISLEGRNGR